MSEKSSFWLVFYLILVFMISTNIPSPLYKVYSETLHFSPLIMTLLFATYAIVLLPSLGYFGRASDRYGRKQLIVIGTVLSIFASVLFALAHSVLLLFIARAFQGLAVGMMSGAATAALMEINPYNNKQSAGIAASIATAGGTAIGPVVGGVIAQYAPFPLITPYAAHLVLVIPGVLGLFCFRETASRVKSIEQVQANAFISEHIKKLAQVASATAMLAWSVTALFMSLIPSYLSVLMHWNNLAYSGAVVGLMLGTSVVVQLLFRTIAAKQGMSIGLVTLMAGLAAIVAAVPLASVVMLLIGTLAAGAGQGLAFKGSMQMVTSIAPIHSRGKMVASLYIYVYIGVGVPIIGVGILTTLMGLFQAVVIFACSIGIFSILNMIRLSRSVYRLPELS